MGTSVSIADIYYQIQDKWQKSVADTKWNIAIWVAPYSNVSIIDKFLEIERTSLGSCEEIFFRFESEYSGDIEKFVKALWEEYSSWFSEDIPQEYNIMAAMRKDGMMKADYTPLFTDTPYLEHLWNEVLRFKSCIKGMDETDFCFYFPPSEANGPDLTSWFDYALKHGIPSGIRLVTIDFVEKRKVKLASSGQVVLLRADFDMKAAINKEMDKECGTYDSTSVDSRFRKQIRTVMDCTEKKDKSLLDKEVNRLFAISNEVQTVSIQIATPLIAAQAYFYISSYKQSLLYTDKTIVLSGKSMDEEGVEGYPIWKVAMFMKAAIYIINKKRDDAIKVYTEVAEKAVQYQDAFYIMEGYRMGGYLSYEKGKSEDAFKFFLLSLAGGCYLPEEVRRQSTFLYSAYMALSVGEGVRSPKELESLKEQLEIWLGDDWQTLVLNARTAKAAIRRKNSIFN